MEKLVDVKRDPKPGYILLSVLNLVGFTALICLLLYTFSTDVFYTDDEFKIDISPADWTHAIWIVIYLVLLAIAIYSLTLACRYNSKTGGQLYYDPPFLQPTFFAILVISYVFDVGHLYLLDEEYLWAALLTRFALWLCVQICIMLSVRLLWKYEAELTTSEHWINIVLVQNGLGLYQTWAGISTMLNIGQVLFYKQDFSMADSCWVSLAVIATVYVITAVYDLLMGIQYRYQISPYLVYVWALAGIVERNYDSEDGHQIFAVFLLAMSILGVLLKYVLIQITLKHKI